MANSLKEENYEDVRGAYEDEITQRLEKHKITYLPTLKAELWDMGYLSASDKELVRIGLYLDDMKNADSDGDYSFETFVLTNLERNPAFFSKYIRQATPEQIEAAREAQPQAKPQQESHQIISAKPINGDRPKQEKTDIFASDLGVLEAVDEAQKYQRDMLERKLKEILAGMGGIDFSSKTSVMSSLAEVGAYKALLVSMLSMLDVEISVTSLEEKAVTGYKTKFYPDKQYSVDDIKKGVAVAQSCINDMVASATENQNIKTEHGKLENRLQIQNRRTVELSQALEQTKDQLRIAQTQTSLNDAKFLYCYLAWDEKEKGITTTYYLTANEGLTEASKTYPVRSLGKSTSAKEALKFKTREDAIRQIERINQFWRKIDHKSGISLDEHINKAYTLEYLKLQNKDSVQSVLKTKSV